MRTFKDVVGLLAKMRDHPVGSRATKADLISAAEDLGVPIPDDISAGALRHLVTNPVAALRALADVDVEWSVATTDSRQALIAIGDTKRVLHVSPAGVELMPSEGDAADSFASAVHGASSALEDLSAPPMALHALLDILESAPSAEYLDELRTDPFGWLHRIDGVWLPQDLATHGEWLLSSSWDFIGPAEPSPMSGNPGWLDLYRMNGRFIFFEGAAGEWYSWEAPRGPLDGEALADAIDAYHDYFVHEQTYSLTTPGWREESVKAFLKTGRDVGLLRVDGRWWYQSPDGWTCEPPGATSTGPAIQLPPGTGDDDSLLIKLGWLYGHASLVDVVLLGGHSVGRLLPLALVAGHKINLLERSDVAVARLKDVAGIWHVGVAVPAGGGHGLRDWLAEATVLTVDTDHGVATFDEARTRSVRCDVLGMPLGFELRDMPSCIRHGAMSGDTVAPLLEGAEASASSQRDASWTPSAPDKISVADVRPPASRYVFRREVGVDDDGRLWVNPRATSRLGGVPGSDVRLIWSEDGSVMVDCSEFGDSEMPQRDVSRHTLRVSSSTE